MTFRDYRLCRQSKGYIKDWGCISVVYTGGTKLRFIAKYIKKMFIEYAECNALGCEASGASDFVMGWGEFQNQGLIYHSLYEACGKKERPGAYHREIVHGPADGKFSNVSSGKEQRRDYVTVRG